MTNEQLTKFLNLPAEQRTSGLVIRDLLLEKVLGDDKKRVLYYYGRTLADDLEFTTLDDAMNQYTEMGFGNITLDKVKKNSYLFQISQNNRFNLTTNPEFSLETGFIAAALKQVLNQVAEGQFQIDIKNQTAAILIQTEPKEAD